MAVFREPLLWFFLCGSMVFLLESVIGESPEPDHLIVLDRALQDTIFDEQALLLGRPATPEEQREALDRYIREDVLVREALRLGIDRNDARIRTILLEKMLFLLGGPAPEPSDETLRSWYSANAHYFTLGAARRFDQVFLAPGSTQIEATRAALESGEAPDDLGDQFLSGPLRGGYTKSDLELVMGSAFTNALFELPLNEWFGPLVSQHGTHFVRIEAERPAYTPTFEEIRHQATEIWAAEQQKEQLTRRYEELLNSYKVSIEPIATATTP